MKLVVRLGNAVLDAVELRDNWAATVAEVVRRGHNVVVIHGGGPLLPRTLAQLTGNANHTRPSDSDMRAATLMVLAGVVNKQLVSAIGLQGVPAMGLCGLDGAGFSARPKKGIDTNGQGSAEISTFDRRWVDATWAQGGIPVLSSITLGPDGEYYQLNTGELAAACALVCNADFLVLPTASEPSSGIRRCRSLQDLAIHFSPSAQGDEFSSLTAYERLLRSGPSEVITLPAAAPQFLLELCNLLPEDAMLSQV